MTYRGRGTPLSADRVALPRMGKIDVTQRLYQTTAFYYGPYVVLGVQEYEQIRDKVDVVEVIPKSEGRVERYSIMDFEPLTTQRGPRWGAATIRGVPVK